MGFVEVTNVLTTGLDPRVILSQNEDGNAPLHVAVSNGHVDVLQLLLVLRKAILNQPPSSDLDSGPAPLFAWNPPDNDSLLLPDGDDNTPLDHAADHENQTILPFLLDQDPPPLVDLSNLLFIATGSGRSEIVRDLLRRGGFDCNKAMGSWNLTSLHVASSYGHIDIVMDLIAYRVHVWAEDSDGETALDAAVTAAHEDVVRVLLTKSPSQKHLNTAIEGDVVRNPAILTQLLNAGADIHHLRPNERTLLHSAAYGDQGEALGILLMRRANTDAKDVHGDTPLADACSRGFVEIARMLLEAGASLTVTNSDNLTPFQHAALGGHEEVVRLLLKRDSRPSLHLQEGKSLIENLIDLKHTNSIAAILDLADPD